MAVSITPLHSLVAALMAGLGAPVLLLPGAQSPHGAALRPSAMRAVADADIVIWIGPTFEASLARALTSTGARTLTLLDETTLEILPARAGPLWSPAPAAGEAPPGDAAAPGDPHFWLDPIRAGRAAALVAQALSESDPGNADRYDANLGRLTERLTALDADIAARLEPVRAAPYVVLHDAFQYFEARYGLSSLGALVREPGQPPGVRRVAAVRAAMRGLGVRCAFAEPQSASRLLASAAQDSGARTAALDPLGATTRPGPDAYFEIIERMAAALAACLADAG